MAVRKHMVPAIVVTTIAIIAIIGISIAYLAT